MRLNWKHSTNKSPVSGGSTLKSQKRSEIFFCGTQSPAPCMLFCKQSTYNSPVWSKTTSRRLWRITSVVDFALFPRASTLFLFWLWHTGWGISRVGRRWIIHPLARRVEQRPDSCRRSSTIKDKYGYVSHVYSAAPGRTHLLMSAVEGELVKLCMSTTAAMTAEVDLQDSWVF